MKTEIHDLLVELSDDEFKFESSEFAKKQKSLESLKEHKKDVVKQLGKDIKVLEAEVSAAATIVETKKAIRSVQCRVEFNNRTETAKVYRIDTGDIVNVRSMTQEELQMNLFPTHLDD